MANISDVDVAIERLRSLLGITYQQAQELVKLGRVGFSIPVTDADLQVNVSLSGSTIGVLPSPLSAFSGRTAMIGTFSSTPTANTPYDVTGAAPSAGKVLYISDIWLEHDGNGRIRLGDNITGNAVVNSVDSIFVSLLSAEPLALHFSVPLIIATKLVAVSDAANPARISWSGWEE